MTIDSVSCRNSSDIEVEVWGTVGEGKKEFVIQQTGILCDVDKLVACMEKLFPISRGLGDVILLELGKKAEVAEDGHEPSSGLDTVHALAEKDLVADPVVGIVS